ncbi:flagellar protein FlgN [Candidatus Hydrogenedentota bacterium]
MSGYAQLVKTLEEEISEYDSLLALKEKEIQDIVDGDAEELVKTSSEMETLLHRTSNLSEQRERTLTELQRTQKLDEKPSLRMLVNAAPEEYEGELKEAHERLERVVTDLRAANERNRIVLEDSLALVSDFIQRLLGTGSDASVAYNPSGESEWRRGNSFIDRKI